MNLTYELIMNLEHSSIPTIGRLTSTQTKVTSTVIKYLSFWVMFIIYNQEAIHCK